MMHITRALWRTATLQKTLALVVMLAMVLVSVPVTAIAEDVPPPSAEPMALEVSALPPVVETPTVEEPKVEEPSLPQEPVEPTLPTLPEVPEEPDTQEINPQNTFPLKAVTASSTPDSAPVCILQSDPSTTFNGAASVPVNPLHSAWTALKRGAVWIWGQNPIVDAQNETTQVFTKTFTLTSLPTSGTLNIAADNSYEVNLNGMLIAFDAGEFNYTLGGEDQITIPVSALQVGQNTLTFRVKNFAMADGTMDTNPAGLLYTVTLYGSPCSTTPPPPPDPETITVSATKVVCNDESLLPNWGTGGPSITASTAADWVATHPGCSLESGWQFEWAYQNGANAGDGTTGPAGNGYTTFGPTNAQGVTTAELPLDANSTEFHLREVLKPGYIPFTHGNAPDNSNAVSAEFYCADDVLNYDNWDFIRSPQKGQTYHCVAFNAPVKPATSIVKVCKFDDAQQPLSGWRLTLGGDQIQDLSVPVNNSAGVDSNPLVAGISYLAKATGTWLNQGGANPVDAEYSTTDGWATHMDGYTGYGPGILETEINQTDGSWGPYNSSHEYVQSFVQGVTGSANFRIFDGVGGVQNEGWFGDNSGSLNISLSEGYAGTTDSTGCVTFTDVPYGTYTVGEVNQQDWTNVSGLGPVTVDSSTETFNVVNKFQPPAPVTLKVHIYKYLQTDAGEAQIPDSATRIPQFPMVSTWKASNLNGGAVTSGAYVLGNGEGGAAYKYAADTSAMNAPADYTTSEVTGDDSPVVANIESCSPGKYYLVGYRNGASLEAAKTAPLSLSPANYQGITTDQYQIVVNRACPSGNGGGDETFSFATTTVTGNTAAGENQPGWLFNRDASNQAPFEFNTTAAAIGTGSLFVKPITNTVNLVNGALDKFIGEYFMQVPLPSVKSISYDFKIGTPDSSVEEQFYLSVYTTFSDSSPTKFYDCRYNVVPTIGSTGSFTTVTFDPTLTYDVTTRTGSEASPYPCPASPVGMDALDPGTPSIRAIALNVGDTSSSDTGVSGYLDKVVTVIKTGTNTHTETFDFEPSPVVEDPDEDDDNDGGGNGRSGGSRRGQVLGTSTTTEPVGRVLGASCELLLPNYLKIGWNNAVEEVMDLQTFLNKEMSLSLPTTGFFGNLTEGAVRSFQLKYNTDVLTPWVGVPDSGITSPTDTTGFVYKSTQWKINMIHCPDLNLPFPQIP